MLGYSIAGGHAAPHEPGLSDPPSHSEPWPKALHLQGEAPDRSLKAQVGHGCEFLTHSSMLPPPDLRLSLP